VKITELANALPDISVPPPGPRSSYLVRELTARESRGVTLVTESFPVVWERAEGSNVWDADGNRYVDMTAGFGVSAAGHNHPRIVAAIRGQATLLTHGMGDVHPPEPKIALLESLAEISPYEDPQIILGGNGGEAVEIALKTAILHTGKPGVIAFTGAYHGLTYGALAVTDGQFFRAPFEAQLNRFVLRAGFPHPTRPPARLAGPADIGEAALADVERMLAGEEGREVGAVIVEPIQGRGGIVVPPPGFLAGLAELCRRHAVLLIADEVMTGFGRTGARFATVVEGIVPDLLCVGKALSGSVPVSACVGTALLMNSWPPSTGEAMHTATFSGNPIACAAAAASLAIIEEEGLAARAARLGEALKSRLDELAARHQAIGDVRGRGLMFGLDMIDAEGAPNGKLARRVVFEALRRGWILLAEGPGGNVLSLTPPLTISEELLEAAVVMLDDVLSAPPA
jgi:4-aminobutyrate aminotransferase